MVHPSAYEVHVTPDPAEALASFAPYLSERPVEHNVLLTVIADQIGGPGGGAYWSVTRNGALCGVAMQTQSQFPLGLSAMEPDVARALARRVAEDCPTLPLVAGVGSASSAFAGHFATVAGQPAAPVAGQRLYQLGELRPPDGVPGAVRGATPADRELLIEWTIAFRDEAGATMGDPEEIVDQKLALDRFWLWEDGGEVVSVTAGTEPAAGYIRVQNVYTPPERRGHGYAAANVTAQCADCMERDGANSLLYTDLANPTSNAVYQRIGFEAIAEIVVYEFGARPLKCS